MSTTKYKIAEQVLLRLRGGKPDASSPWDIRDIILAVGQVANMTVKATYFNQTLPNGETTPDSCIIGTYPNIQVTSYKNVSKATLPCMPVNLVRGQGVQQVGSMDDEFCQFIPMSSSDFVMLKSQPLINDLLGLIGYKLEGLDLIFYTDITKLANPIKKIEAKLLVLDMDNYSEFAPLPIPADYEGAIVEQVFAQFAGKTLPANPSTDLINNEKQ